MIRFVDLFAGIGGIRLGFERASARLGVSTKCVLSSEIDSKAQEAYALNFNEFPSGDIRSVHTTPAFDFLLAGFPCQPFSYAGKQRGFGDTRGTLFFEIERLLEQQRPAGFLLENVRGLTTHDQGNTFATIVCKLEALGYGVSCLLLNSSDFGVPQNRVRIYIAGLFGRKPKFRLQSNRGAVDSHRFKSAHTTEDLFAKSERRLVSDILVSDAPASYDCTSGFSYRLMEAVKRKNLPIEGLRLIDYRNGNSVHSWEIGLKGECSDSEVALMNAIIANRRKKHFGTQRDGKPLSEEQIRTFFDHPNLSDVLSTLVAKKYLSVKDGMFNPVSGNMSFEIFKVLDPKSVAITLVSSDAHKLGVYHNGRLRRLTPRECARLQGYPDDFALHPDDLWAYHQLGNSVSVPVVERVISELFELNDVLSVQRGGLALNVQNNTEKLAA